MSKRTEFIIDHITKEMSEGNLSELDLKAAVGLCSWNLIYCNKCTSTLATSCEQFSDDKPWCVKSEPSTAPPTTSALEPAAATPPAPQFVDAPVAT